MADSRVIDPEELGKGKGIHWLTHEKSNLHRVGGRDELGRPMEEKVPRMRSEVMCDSDGNEVHVAIETGRTRSRLSFEKYGRIHRETMILEHGYLPRAECPHTRRYGRPLAPLPEGDEACEGEPGGCAHYRRIRARRVAEGKSRAKDRKAVMGAISEAQAKQFVTSLTAMAGAMSDAAPAPARVRGPKPRQADEADDK